MPFKNETRRKICTENMMAYPPPPSKFTLQDWHFNDRMKTQIIGDQLQLADRILSESERLMDETTNKCKLNKTEVDHRIDEKIDAIEFLHKELIRGMRGATEEIETLDTCKERIIGCLTSLQRDGFIVCKKCILLREERLGIDLANDDVDQELRKELSIMEASIAILNRTLEQATEQIRRLRSTLYFIERDSEDKMKAILIDKSNKMLTPTALDLNLYQGCQKLDPAVITYQEWYANSSQIINNASKEINCAVQMRTYIETILTEVISDLNGQHARVNSLFEIRINETKEQKMRLEIKHGETVRQANEMTLNISKLESKVSEKQGYLAVAHTRLANRAKRPGIELCKDEVEMKLMVEIRDVKNIMEQLQQMILEAKASLRYLLRTQIQIEEDINIKINTLKIDEVECMTMRLSVKYYSY